MSADSYRVRGNEHFVRGEFADAAADYSKAVVGSPPPLSLRPAARPVSRPSPLLRPAPLPFSNSPAPLFFGPAPANSPSRLKSAQALAPEATVHWLNRALCYLKQEKWDLVLGDCTRALALDPAAVRALYYQGCALTKLARYTEAIASLKSGAACAADALAHDGRRRCCAD